PPWAGTEDTLAVDERRRPLVQADPGLHALCATWATDALSGNSHRGVGARVFGTDTGWLSWHWREVLLGVLGACASRAAFGWFLRRRGRRLRRA
ncbi:MAG TPA: hypothetical protein VD864_10895, partial [Nocardioides sp.]|nr:hypothetical protein [Nocardioides sp.]